MADDMDMDYSSDEDVEMPEQLSEMFARTLKSDEEEVIEADLGEATIIKQFTVDSSCKDQVVTLQLSLPSQDIQFQVCHLRPGKVEQFHTEIVLEETAVLSIVRGKGPVHVIGNVVISTNLAEFGESDDEDLTSEEDESAEEGELPRVEDITGKDQDDEEQEEAPKLVKASGKRNPSKASGKAKKAKVQVEDEDESEDEEEEDEEDESEDEDDLEDEDMDVQTRVKRAVTKASRQKKQQQQQQKKKSAPTTPAKKNGTKSVPSTPAKAKGKDGDVSMDEMLKKVLASPNKPKKQAKFKNFCKNLFKLENQDNVLDELWQKYSASISK